MRIVLMGSQMSLVSGHSRPAFELTTELRRRGHDVRLISTRIHSSKLGGTSNRLIEEKSWMDSEVVQYFGSARDLILSNSVRRTIHEHLEWCDVLHCFSLFTGSLVARMNRRTRQRPSVLTLGSNYGLRPHQFGFPLRPITMMSLLKPSIVVTTLAPCRLYRKLLEPFDRVHSWSDYMLRKVYTWGIPEERGVKTSIGVRVERFQSEATARTESGPLYLYIGWLSELRGARDLLAAFHRVLTSKQNARLVIASTGFHGIEERKLAREFHSYPRVEVTGFHDDLGSLIKCADAIVLPFRSCVGYSQPPLVLLEAMACGRPVITTRVGAIPEFVTDGETGLLVGSGDVDQLTDAMLRVTDRELANSLGLAALSRVKTFHHWAKAAAEMETVYRAIWAKEMPSLGGPA